MSSAFDDFRKKKHFGSLDGLRALSIVGVVWHHAARGHDLPWAEHGSAGVPLFFAISGFLITTLLLRERARTGDISLGAFYARRSLRIFPLYYTVLGIYLVAVALFERNAGDKAEFFSNLKYFLTYTSNWFVEGADDGGRVIFYFAWSLAAEEQFYLVWPSVERVVGRRLKHAPVVVAVGLVALWGLGRLGLLPLAHDSFVLEVILSVSPAICFGVMLAHALDEPRSSRALASFLGHKAASVLLLPAMLVSIAAAPQMVTFALMALLVGACVIREDHLLAPVLQWRPIASIGQVSYGVYLMHMLVVNAVERVLAKASVVPASLPAPIAVFPLALLGVWAVAWLSFNHYEARFLKLKERFVR